MDLGFIVILLIAGLFSGFFAGLLGIGGGMMIVPLLTIIYTAKGFAPEHIVHIAIATSLGIILFTSMSSVYAHNKRGAVRWRLVALLIPGVVLGSWVGPIIAANLSTRYLASMFAVIVAYSGVRMLTKKKAKDTTIKPLPGSAAMAAAGFGIGGLSGLVGAGGGFVTVPFLTWRGVSIHHAVATSAAMGFPIALVGAASNVFQGWDVPGLPAGSLGYVYVPALLSVAAASVLSAPFGARLAHALNVAQLRKVFAGLLFLLAFYMFWKAISVNVAGA